MDLNTLITECTAYDYKEMLEENKPKSWLKSVSAFPNGLGGSLFYGVNNDGVVVGLDNVPHVCEAIRNKIRDFMDPLPDVGGQGTGTCPNLKNQRFAYLFPHSVLSWEGLYRRSGIRQFRSFMYWPRLK